MHFQQDQNYNIGCYMTIEECLQILSKNYLWGMKTVSFPVPMHADWYRTLLYTFYKEINQEWILEKGI